MARLARAAALPEKCAPIAQDQRAAPVKVENVLARVFVRIRQQRELWEFAWRAGWPSRELFASYPVSAD